MTIETGASETPASGVEPADEERFFKETGLAAEIARIAEPVIIGLGYRLVRVQLSGQDGQTLQIMAERPDGTMAIEDCETLSRDLSAIFDTLDPMRGAYRLEISSPGIDRPLVRAADFEDWAGFEARVELKEAVSGRRRWRGILEGFVDDEVRMVCEIEGMGPQTVGFPVSLIDEAKLVLTDDLVRQALRDAKKGQAEAEGKSDSAQPRRQSGRKSKRGAKGKGPSQPGNS